MNWTLLLIPLISGVIGYVTNFAGIKMLFYPVAFFGFRLPGLSEVAQLLPRRFQNVPGVLTGRVGWQGVIPSRAAKMGSIAVDKGIAKLGSPAEFYEKLDPDVIAAHIVATTADEVRDLVERTIEREHPTLWRDTPPRVRAMIHRRVQEQLPDIVRTVTNDIGVHIDQLLDIKLMVIRHIEADPNLANRIFLEVGKKELQFVINSGFVLGTALGIPVLIVQQLVDSPWVLPFAGIVVGYLTNWIALKVIFEPPVPRRVGPFTLHGLFIRRQAEVADVYATIIAEDIVNLANIGTELTTGARADRTRDMIANALRPAVDRAIGPAAGALRVAVGAEEYDAIKDSVADEAISYTMTPLSDAGFNEQQSHAIHALLRERMIELPPDDFGDMLRSAIQEDEWMLILIGSVLGFAAGCLQMLTVL